MSAKHFTEAQPFYRAAPMRDVDQQTCKALRISEFDLMCKAGAAALQVLARQWPDARRIMILCGTGNNGGDGWVLAQLLIEAGYHCQVALLGDPSRIVGAARTACDSWRDSTLADHVNAEALSPDSLEAGRYDVVVDALTGIGLAGPARDTFVALVTMINTSRLPVMSLDVPSGVDADTGSIVGAAIHASVTVTFIAHKPGLLTGAARNHVGHLILADLGTPPSVFESVPADGYRISASGVRTLPARPSTAHKGHFGHVLVIGGNQGMGGAALLAAGAALRGGAGLVSLVTRSEHVSAALVRHPELMVKGLDDATQLPELCRDKSVIVIGPGLGQDDWAWQCLKYAVAARLPLVCDADALNVIATREVTVPAEIPLIMTPHPGEASRLAGVTTAEIESDRVTWAKRLADRSAAVVVLKGAGTVIAPPPNDDTLFICADGNPGMATGGMGDVLAGLIGALLAQGLSVTEASALGVAIHARAGDLAWEQYGVGLTATDVADGLGVALSHTARSV